LRKSGLNKKISVYAPEHEGRREGSLIEEQKRRICVRNIEAGGE
jgi:hypothetical protein